MSKKLTFDFNPAAVKSLIDIRKTASQDKNFPSGDTYKALELYFIELDESVKLLKQALAKRDFVELRKHSYSIEVVSNWIIRIVKKYE